eukprot:TRINITY_DN6763_c0_g2_i4.p1 TRINITY_DN6763_c0_g2~~TRINITY_DN6763_c0_g2_i4.p1  ORF type:complete len:935 (-),score=275.79 TRINITY_DN6763_c0_g2_i4:111-2915(-)
MLAPPLPAVELEKRRVIAQWVAQDQWQLDLYVDDLVTVLDKFDGEPEYEGWWSGRVGDDIGIFPVSYTEPYQRKIFKQNEKNISSMIKQLQAQCGFLQQKGESQVASLHLEFQALQSELKGHALNLNECQQLEILETQSPQGSLPLAEIPLPSSSPVVNCISERSEFALLSESTGAEKTQETVAALQEELKSLKETLETTNHLLKDTERELEKKEFESKGFLNHLNQVEEKNKQLVKELERYKEENSEISEKLDGQRSVVYRLGEEMQVLKREHARDLSTLQQSEKDRSELDAKLVELQEQLVAQNNALSALTKQNRDYALTISQQECVQDKMQQIIAKHKAKKQKFRASGLHSSMMYALDIPDAQQVAKLKESNKVLKVEVATLNQTNLLLNASLIECKTNSLEEIEKIQNENQINLRSMSDTLEKEKKKVDYLQHTIKDLEANLLNKSESLLLHETSLRNQKKQFSELASEKEDIELRLNLLNQELADKERKIENIKKEYEARENDYKKACDHLQQVSQDKEKLAEQLEDLRAGLNNKARDTVSSQPKPELKVPQLSDKDTEIAKLKVELARANHQTEQMIRMLSMARDTQEQFETLKQEVTKKKKNIFQKQKPPKKDLLPQPPPPPQTQSKIKELEEQIQQHSRMVDKMLQERESLLAMNRSLMTHLRETFAKLRTLEEQRLPPPRPSVSPKSHPPLIRRLSTQQISPRGVAKAGSPPSSPPHLGPTVQPPSPRIQPSSPRSGFNGQTVVVGQPAVVGQAVVVGSCTSGTPRPLNRTRSTEGNNNLSRVGRAPVANPRPRRNPDTCDDVSDSHATSGSSLESTMESTGGSVGGSIGGSMGGSIGGFLGGSVGRSPGGPGVAMWGSSHVGGNDTVGTGEPSLDPSPEPTYEADSILKSRLCSTSESFHVGHRGTRANRAGMRVEKLDLEEQQ